MALEKPTKLENILAFTPIPVVGERAAAKRAHYRVENKGFIKNNYHYATARAKIAERNSKLLTRGLAYSPLILGLTYYLL